MQQLLCLRAWQTCSLGVLACAQRFRRERCRLPQNNEHLHVEQRRRLSRNTRGYKQAIRTAYHTDKRNTIQALPLLVMCCLLNRVRGLNFPYPQVCCGASPCQFGPPTRCRRGDADAVVGKTTASTKYKNKNVFETPAGAREPARSSGIASDYLSIDRLTSNT